MVNIYVEASVCELYDMWCNYVPTEWELWDHNDVIVLCLCIAMYLWFVWDTLYELVYNVGGESLSISHENLILATTFVKYHSTSLLASYSVLFCCAAYATQRSDLCLIRRFTKFNMYLSIEAATTLLLSRRAFATIIRSILVPVHESLLYLTTHNSMPQHHNTTTSQHLPPLPSLQLHHKASHLMTDTHTTSDDTLNLCIFRAITSHHYLVSLPKDVWEVVIQHLGCWDIKMTSQTCHLLHTITQSPQFQFRTIAIVSLYVFPSLAPLSCLSLNQIIVLIVWCRDRTYGLARKYQLKHIPNPVLQISGKSIAVCARFLPLPYIHSSIVNCCN